MLLFSFNLLVCQLS